MVGSGKVVRRAAAVEGTEEASRRRGRVEAAVGPREREGDRERERCIRLDPRLSLSNLIIILDYRGPFALVTRHRITRRNRFRRNSFVKKETSFFLFSFFFQISYDKSTLQLTHSSIFRNSINSINSTRMISVVSIDNTRPIETRAALPLFIVNSKSNVFIPI